MRKGTWLHVGEIASKVFYIVSVRVKEFTLWETLMIRCNNTVNLLHIYIYI